MAVEIKTTSENGEKTNLSQKYNNEVFATQGNVVQTIIAFNEQIKKQYTDNDASKEENDSIQESLRVLAATLDKNTQVSGTFASGTSVKDTDLQNDKTGSKSFDASGLINKINILANIISGSTDGTSQTWSATTVGNTVGKKSEGTLQTQTTDNVPVIGYAKGETDYTLSGDYDNNRHTSPSVNGLTTVEGTDVSSNVVLSERQTADMVEASSKSIIDYYNGQIDVIKDFMRGLNSSDSFSYALLHCTKDYVNYAPMQIVGYDTSDSGFEYKIQMLNNKIISLPIDGATYHIALDSYGNASLVKGAVTSPANIGTSSQPSYFGYNLTYNDTTSSIDISIYNNENWNDTYSLPVERRVLNVTINGVTDTASTEYSIIAGTNGYTLVNNAELVWTTDGSKATASVSVPVGMGAMVTLNDHGTLHIEKNGVVSSLDSYTLRNNDTFYIYSLDSDVNVYSKCYNVEIDYANGSAVETQVVLEGKTISGLYTDVTRNGYTLNGYVDSQLETVTLATVVSSDMKVKANWNPVEYTITYVGDFDTALNANPKKYTIEDTVNLEPVSKARYAFNGWYTESACTHQVEGIPAGTTGNKTFYISYIPETYTITYVLDGGSFESASYATTYTYGVGAQLTEPTRNQRVFAGWYTDVNLTSSISSISETAYGNYTLYAKWNTTGNYNINYVLDGGDNNPSNLSVYTVANCPLVLLTPSKVGYTFAGWYTSSTFGSSSAISVIKEEDAKEYTLYAKFEAKADTEFKINYYVLIDGKNFNLTKTDYKKTYSDEIYTLDKTMFENDYEGFVLLETNTYSKVINADGTTEFNIYYVPDTYDITYNFTGFVKNTNDFANEPRKYSYSAKALYLPEVEAVDGYIFDGWYEILNNQTYFNKKSRIDSYSMGDKTFYAKWTRCAPDKSLFTVKHQATISGDGSIEVDFNNISKDSILEYYTDDTGAWTTVTSTTSTINYIGEIKFRYAETNNVKGYIPTSPEVAFIIKKFVSAPSSDLFKTTKASSDIASDGAIVISSVAYGLEYATSTNTKYSVIHEGTTLLNLPGDTAYYFRYAETDTSIASASTAVTLGTKTIPAAPDAVFEVTNASTHYTNDAKVKVNYTEKPDLVIEYSTNNGDSYSPLDKVSREVTGLSMGAVVLVRWKGTAKTLPSEAVSVTVGVKYYNVTFDYADIDLSTNTKVSTDLVVSVRGGDLIAEPDNPLREGYSFVEWTSNDAKHNFSSEVTEDITITATWKANKYPITYLPGRYSSSLIDVVADFSALPKLYTYDSPMTLTDFTGEAISENYRVDFEYWTLNGERVDSLTALNTHTTEGIYLTARWVDVTPPNSVNNITAFVEFDKKDIGNLSIKLDWNNPEDNDFSLVRVYVDGSNDKYGNKDVIFESSDDTFTLLENGSPNGKGTVLIKDANTSEHTIVFCTVDKDGNEQSKEDAASITIPAYSLEYGTLNVFTPVDVLLRDGETTVSNVAWAIDSTEFTEISGNTIINKNISTEVKTVALTATVDNITFHKTLSLPKVAITLKRSDTDTLTLSAKGTAGAYVEIEKESSIEDTIAVSWDVVANSDYVTYNLGDNNKSITLNGTGLYCVSSNEKYAFTVTPTVKVGEYSTTLSTLTFNIKSAKTLVEDNQIVTAFDATTRKASVTAVNDSAGVDAQIAEKLSYSWYKYENNYTSDEPVLLAVTDTPEYIIPESAMGDDITSIYVTVYGMVSMISITRGITSFVKNDVSLLGLKAVSSSAPKYNDEDDGPVDFVVCNTFENFIYITPVYKYGGITTVTLKDANNEVATIEVDFGEHHMFSNIQINSFDDVPTIGIFDLTPAESIASNTGVITVNSSLKSYRTLQYSLNGADWSDYTGPITGLAYDKTVYFVYNAVEGAYNRSTESFEVKSGVRYITVTVEPNDAKSTSSSKVFTMPNGESINKYISQDYINTLSRTGHSFIGLSKTGNWSYTSEDFSNIYIYQSVSVNHTSTGASYNFPKSSNYSLTLSKGTTTQTLTASWVPLEYTARFSLGLAKSNPSNVSFKDVKYIYGQFIGIPTFDSPIYIDKSGSYSESTSQVVEIKGWSLNPTDIVNLSTYSSMAGGNISSDSSIGFISPTDVAGRLGFTAYAMLVDNTAIKVSNVVLNRASGGDYKLTFAVPNVEDLDSVQVYVADGFEQKDVSAFNNSNVWIGTRQCDLYVYNYVASGPAWTASGVYPIQNTGFTKVDVDITNFKGKICSPISISSGYEGKLCVIRTQDSSRNIWCTIVELSRDDLLIDNSTPKISTGNLYLSYSYGEPNSIYVQNIISSDKGIYATVNGVTSITGTGAKPVGISVSNIKVCSVNERVFSQRVYNTSNVGLTTVTSEPYTLICDSNPIEVVDPFTLSVTPSELYGKTESATISITKAADNPDLGTVVWGISNDKSLVFNGSPNSSSANVKVYDGYDAESGNVKVSATDRLNHTQEVNILINFESVSVSRKASDLGFSTITNAVKLNSSLEYNSVVSSVNNDKSSVTFTTLAAESDNTRGYAGDTTYVVYGTLNDANTDDVYNVYKKVFVRTYITGRLEVTQDTVTTIQYNVVFNGNGGVVEGGNIATVYVASGTSAHLTEETVNSINASNYGHKFVRWAYDTEGTQPYSVDDSITSNIVLYAIWEDGFYIEADTNPLYLNCNTTYASQNTGEIRISKVDGAEFSATSIPSYTSANELIATVAENGNGNNRDVCTVKGNNVGTTTVSAKIDKVTKSYNVKVVDFKFTDDVTEFELGQTAVIKVGLEGMDDATITASLTGQHVTGSYNASTREYTLTTDAKGSLGVDNTETVKIKAELGNTGLYIEKEITLKEATYEVVLHVNDVKSENQVVTKVIQHGGFIPSIMNTIGYSGYILEGWYTTSDFSSAKYNFATQPVTGPLELYAKWIDSFDVSSDPVTIASYDTSYASISIQDSTKYSLSDVVISDESNILSYNVGGDGAVTITAGLISEYNPNYKIKVRIGLLEKEIRVIAKPKYTIEFNSLGGTDVPSQTVIYGDLATKPTSPTKFGWTLEDWYSSTNIVAVNKYTFTEPVTSDINLYANWVDTVSAGSVSALTAEVTEPVDGKVSVKLSWVNPTPEDNDLTYIGVVCDTNTTHITKTDPTPIITTYTFDNLAAGVDHTFEVNTYDKVSNKSNPTTIVVKGISITGEANVSIGQIQLGLEASNPSWRLDSDAYASINESGLLTGSDNAGKIVKVFATTGAVTYEKTVSIVDPYTVGTIITLIGDTISENVIVTKAPDVKDETVSWSTASTNIIKIDSTSNYVVPDGNIPQSMATVSVARVTTATTGNAILTAVMTSGENISIKNYIVPVKYEAKSVNIKAAGLSTSDTTISTISRVEHNASRAVGVVYNEADGITINSIQSAYETLTIKVFGKASDGGDIETTIEAFVDTTGNVGYSQGPIVPIYIVKLNKNADTAYLNGATELVVERGGVIPTIDTEAHNDGYIFRGWYTEASCTTPFTDTTTVMANTTIYAKWENGFDIDTKDYILNNGENFTINLAFKPDYVETTSINWNTSNSNLATILEGTQSVSVVANSLGNSGTVNITATVGNLTLTCEVKVVYITLSGFASMNSTGELNLILNISDNYKDAEVEWQIQE